MSRFAPHLSRLFSRLLLLIMLATVFSPSFGWEMIEGSQSHDDSPPLNLAQVDHADCHEHTLHDAPNGGELNHHCCPGHVLGHLPATLSQSPVLTLPRGSTPPDTGDCAAFSSRPPEGLERLSLIHI